jgi:hypothetical protein
MCALYRLASVIPALRHRALYAAFDRFPSRKGSAVHIDQFARTLFEQAGGGLLYVLGADGLPPYQREGSVEIVRYSRPAEHLLERAAGFGARLNAMRETVALRGRHRFVPFPRALDDQFARAALARPAIAPATI